MFGSAFKIGRLFGIKITLSSSFLVLMVLWGLTQSLAHSVVEGLVHSTLSLGLIFGSVLLHELGHSLVARRFGVDVAEIELHFFGGTAKMLSMPKRPRDEVVIAAAGPAVSLLLALGAGLLLVPAYLWAPTVVARLAAVVFQVNLMLGLFNLLPALPMDGGRILRAALTPRFGGYRATRVAVTVARVVAGAMVVYGLLATEFFLVAIAAFIWLLGTRELKLAEMIHGHRPGAEVYDRFGRVVGPAPEPEFHGQSWQPDPRGNYAWHEAPASQDFSSSAVRRVVVRGPDGRIWVITETR
jgi:Zn-dependent protease